MQTKTWRMKEGFLIGGCLILIGLALQWSVGPVVWEALAWPSNGMVLTGFLLMLITMFLLRKKIYAFQFISTCQAAIPALVYAVALTILMGVTPQEAHGTGLNNMLACWPFVLIYTYIDLILGQIILRRTANCQLSIVNLKKDIPFLLLHLGLFLTLTTATLGHADLQRVKMMTATGVPERRALTPDGMVKNMPMSIELKRFIMETYDDGTPKRFASHLLIQTETGRKIETLVDVNKPYEVDGWSIYQLDYDTRMDPQHPLSILELVSDPWLPIVYAGIYLMLAGALLLLTYTHWSHKRWWPIATVVLVALACVSHFMPIIRATQLVPALQSPWFTPHILVYILCYSLFGAVALLALWTLIRGKQSAIRSHHLDNLVFVGLMFMTFGMLFGAFWAKEAWGDYWSWDPKETWAAITWFAYLVYIHYRQLPHHHERLSRWMLIISFLLLQMCWWGIKYLPSAQKTSVHVYTMNE